MLEKLTIRDYQLHEKLVLEFGNGVTTLTGPSESGKSAAVRALRTLTTNRSAGVGSIRRGSEGYRLRLRFDDGRSLGRIRGVDNTYILDGRELRAFGTNVPEEVSEALNVCDLTFQGQHDPPFGFNLSPAQLSRNLNEIVNLESIDTALANVMKELRKAKATVGVCRDRLKGAKKVRESLSWVRTMRKRLLRLERLYSMGEDLRLKASSLGDTLGTIQTLSRREKGLGGLVNASPEVVERGERIAILSVLIGELKRLLEQLGKAKRKSRVVVPEIDHVEALKTEGDTVDTKCSDLEHLLGQIEEAERIENQCHQQLRTSEKRLRKLSKGKCPTCGTPLSSYSSRTCTSGRRHSPAPLNLPGMKSKSGT